MYLVKSFFSLRVEFKLIAAEQEESTLGIFYYEHLYLHHRKISMLVFKEFLL